MHKEHIRGPANKLIWLASEQLIALRQGFFIGVRQELVPIPPYADRHMKFERAKINRLSPNLSKPLFLDMFNAGLASRDPFWLKLEGFINQQTTKGYSGAWEPEARTIAGVRRYEMRERTARLHRQHNDAEYYAQSWLPRLKDKNEGVA